MNRTVLISLLPCLLVCGALAGDRVQVQIFDSETATSSYNIPAQGYCTHNYLTGGENCGVQGASVATVGWVRLKARLNEVNIWLTCNSTEKNCGTFTAGTYTAEPKGKDKLIVYGWTNPLYRGNLKKATKVVFQVSAREDVAVIHSNGESTVQEH